MLKSLGSSRRWLEGLRRAASRAAQVYIDVQPTGETASEVERARISHDFKGLKADEILAPPESRQPAESESMWGNMVATRYVADYKTDSGLQSSLEH